MQLAWNKLCRIILVTVLFTCIVAAQQRSQKQKSVNQTTVTWAKRALQQAGGFTLWLSNQMTMGEQAWDGSTPADDCKDPGLGASYPPSLCIEHLFNAYPMFAGLVKGVRRVVQGGNLYSTIPQFIPSQKDTSRDKMWITMAQDTLYDYNLTDQFGRHDSHGRLMARSLKHYYLDSLHQHYTVNRRNVDDDGDGRVDEDELDGVDNDGDWSRDPVTHELIYNTEGHLVDDLGSDDLPDSLEIGCKGRFDPVTNPDPAYDNYSPGDTDFCHLINYTTYRLKNDKNIYTQNNDIPDHGEPHVDEDFGAFSDHDIYFGATDTAASPINPTSAPMKIKIWARSYAWGENYYNCIMPMEYYFINIGQDTIRDIYAGFYADMDVGPVSDPEFYYNNYSAYYPDIHLAYTHNPLEIGSTPLGLMLVQTPAPLYQLQYTFQSEYVSTSPCYGSTESELYGCMSCAAFNDTGCINSTHSVLPFSDARFTYAFGNKRYDPLDNSTWVREPKFDMLAPGDTLKIEIAFITGDAVETGENSMVSNAKKMIYRWDTPLIVPLPPCLDMSTDSNRVRLKWGRIHPDCDRLYKNMQFKRSVQTTANEGAPFPQKVTNEPHLEGYRVYRSEDPSGSLASFALLHQFDLVDGIGYDTGLDTTYVDSLVQRGKSYWYAVTWFSTPESIKALHPNPSNPSFLDTVYLQGDGMQSEIYGNQTKVYIPFGPSTTLGKVKVVPNPYLGNTDYTNNNGYEGNYADWSPWKRKVRFIDLPPKATIRIYTIAGEIIHTIYHDDASGSTVGQEDFYLLAENNQALAPGIFIFTVESEYGTQTGKFVVLY